MRKNNVLIYLVTALIAFGQSISRGNFPSYVEVLGGTIVSYGFIQSVQTFSNLLFLFPAALLADKLGHRRLILSGTLVYSMSFFLIAFTPQWEFLLIGAFGVGLAGGMIMPSQVAILAHDNPNSRINVFTRNETARWSSLALGYLFSSFFFFLFQNEFSYRNLQWTMIGTLGITLLAIIPSLFLANTNEWRNNSKDQEDIDLRAMIVDPEGKFVIGFLLISLMIGFGAGFLVPFSQPYFVRRFSLGPSEINVIMALAQIMTAVFMGIIPSMSNKFSNTKVIYLTQGLSIPLVLILAYSKILPLSLFAFLFRIALMNMSRPAQITVLQKYVPATFRARVQSLMQVSDRLGRSFSPSISAILIEETDEFYHSYSITALMYSAAVLTLYLITKKLKRNLRIKQRT